MNTLYCIFPLLQAAPTQEESNLIAWILTAFVFIAFLAVIIVNRIAQYRIHHSAQLVKNTNSMVEQALKISKTNVVYYDILNKRISPLYGDMLPAMGVSLNEWQEHVHPEDLPYALEQFGLLMRGEIIRAEFDYRWNPDFSGTNNPPQWANLHNVSVAEYIPSMSRPRGLVSTLTDETKLIEQQEYEKKLTEKYKFIFDQSLIGLSFYTAEGTLIDANRKMREICHFDDESKLEFFFNSNLFDLQPFRDCINKNNVEEFWVCSRSDLSTRIHTFMEIRLHPIKDEDGKLLYIAISARDVTEEREMYLQSRMDDIQIQKANEEIQRYETEIKYIMDAIDTRVWRSNFKDRTIQFHKGLSEVEREMTYDEFKTHFIDLPEELYNKLAHPQEYFNKPQTQLYLMRPIFHDAEDVTWNLINSVPIFDEDGNMTGCFGIIRNMNRFMLAQERLKAETQRANESGRLKSVFIANMTHEIRTPLNAIVGFTDLLQMMTTTEEKQELIRVIHNNCDMLLRLIDDIMVISAMDSNGLIIRPEDCDFAREFNSMCDSLSQRVENPNVQFIKENPYKTLHIKLDVGRITQVLTNFVTNAVKYTEKGHIKVGYRLQDKGIYLYCEDTGTGIPKEQCPKIFERFVKLNEFIQGTGLGLSICKAIAEHYDGEIGVDSELGEGATFWIWVPCAIDNFELIKE